MKKDRNISYLLMPTIEGVTRAFPVSKHMLDMSRSGSPLERFGSRARRALPSLVKPATSLILLVTLCASTVGMTYASSNSTLSYFRDIESSTGNSFGAALLDFLVTDESIARTITPTTTPLMITVTTPEPGSIDALYDVTSDEIGGPAALCAALDLHATTTPFTYSGPLLGLTTTATTTDGAWTFDLSLSTTTGLTDGDICTVDLVFHGWMPSLSYGAGFFDEERVHLTITYSAPPVANDFDVVLNEFLPNPDDTANGQDFGDDGSNMPLGEWIELYNKGDAAVDVENWYMTDASGGAGNTHAVINAANTNTGSTMIPPHGWLVVYLNKPSLNNTGDEIHLYTDNDVEVDFVSYNDPSTYCSNDITLGDANADETSGAGTPGNGPKADCVANQVAPNKSYARFPDGTGPWYDPIPTPGDWNRVVAGDELLVVSSDEPLGPAPIDADDAISADEESSLPDTADAESSPTPPEETPADAYSEDAETDVVTDESGDEGVPDENAQSSDVALDAEQQGDVETPEEEIVEESTPDTPQPQDIPQALTEESTQPQDPPASDTPVTE